MDKKNCTIKIPFTKILIFKKRYLVSILFAVFTLFLTISSFAAPKEVILPKEEGSNKEQQEVQAKEGPKPRILISSYSTKPSQISPGNAYILHLVLTNESLAAANNIFMTLGVASVSTTGSSGDKESDSQGGGGDDSLVVLGTSNARSIRALKPKEKKELQFKMISSGKASPGIYKLGIDLEYDNASGNSYTSSQSIGVVIKRAADIKVANIKYPQSVLQGKEFTVSADVNNQSGFKVNNVSLEFFSEDFEISDGLVYIGALDSGDNDALEATVVARDLGEKKGLLIARYKDDFGNKKSIKKEIKIRIKPAPKSNPVKKSAQSKGFLARAWAFFKAFLGLGG